MNKTEKLALLESLVRQEGDTNNLVYARMYGMLSVLVEEKEIDRMIAYKQSEKESN